jgi:nucleoside-diphosphate-sugar epimerase
VTQGFSIIGADGFVGRHLIARLLSLEIPARVVRRSDLPLDGKPLGHVIYAVGVTADFRSKPYETIASHVSLLSELLAAGSYESFLYLSSTRVYLGSDVAREDDDVRLCPAQAGQLYNASKLAGESLCLSLANTAIRVVRLSNLFGPGDRSDNFLPAIIAEARQNGRVMIRTSQQSEKDYLHVDDACDAAVKIAQLGTSRLYNVASGMNVSNREIAALIRDHMQVPVEFAAGAPTVTFPVIDTSRLRSEFSVKARSLASAFAELVAAQ